MKARLSPALVALGATLIGAGCATTRPAQPAGPDYSPVAGQPVTVNGELYVECLHAAILAKTYDVTADRAAKLLRFRCAGMPAQRLYDALGARSASQHSEWIFGGRTWRSTQRIERDLVGSDICSTVNGSDFRCDIVLNVGEFLLAPHA